MSLLAAPVDYSDRDFDSLRLRLQSLTRSAFPTWTDFNVADFGNILLELFAFVFDVLGFYQDTQAREAFIATATRRANLIALAKLLGYKPASQTPATANQQFTLAAVPVNPVTLPAGTVVKNSTTADAVRFRLLSAVLIPAGTNPPVGTGVVENSEAQSQGYVATGTANQQLALPVGSYVDGSAVVVAGNGTFTEVRNFLASKATDKHFTVSVDELGKATITFGNGINGALPTGSITVTWKTGGGSAGNLGAGALKYIEGSFQDSLGNPVTVTTTNTTGAGGGSEQTTNDQIRQLAPEALRALTRAVAREDFEITARQVPGVARALFLTSDEDNAIAENTGILFAVPTTSLGVTPAQPSDALRAAIEAKFASTGVMPTMITFKVYTAGGTGPTPAFVTPVSYKPISIVMTVYPRAGVEPATLKARILAELNEFFRVSLADGSPNTQIDFGFNLKDDDGNVVGEITRTAILDLVADTVGVRKVDDLTFTLNGGFTDIVLAARDFPTLGTVSLFNGDTGLPL